ncbi:hypothetical protein NBH00_22600 [Paraconexibacter antarcticus]|uniref:Uncharacterized protein n=1 Tax=Paraconexibacter antarcticus TaxID=2949664 RepID=A0ABY5DQ05_9ACTN|nr:hypothetical protein [Paraconexibacter antarcticus]UTI64115.1 hypothetical protein NBH00_22600 [Paraconexibacter antarcticus]
MSLRPTALPTTAAAATALALAATATPAAAAATTFATRTLTEPAATSLPVSGPLKAYVAGSKARVVVPTAWAAGRASGGALRFTATQNSACHYAITYRVRTVVGEAGDAGARVAAELPAANSRYLLDQGARGAGRAFRVIRDRATGDGRVRLHELWAGVLTRRADIVPAGKVAWTELRVTATSGAADECHSGTYRDALGPNLGDSLAVARTALHFTGAS